MVAEDLEDSARAEAAAATPVAGRLAAEVGERASGAPGAEREAAPAFLFKPARDVMGPREVAPAAPTAVPESGAGVAIAAGMVVGVDAGRTLPGRGRTVKIAPGMGTGWSKSGAAGADGGRARGASSPWGS